MRTVIVAMVLAACGDPDVEVAPSEHAVQIVPAAIQPQPAPPPDVAPKVRQLEEPRPAPSAPSAADLEQLAVTFFDARPKPRARVGDLEAVLDVLHGATKRIRNCYQRKLVDQPKLAGKLVLDISISTDGIPRDVTPSSFDADVGQCVAAVVRSLRFAPRKRVEWVRFPFVFVAG